MRWGYCRSSEIDTGLHTNNPYVRKRHSKLWMSMLEITIL